MARFETLVLANNKFVGVPYLMSASAMSLGLRVYICKRVLEEISNLWNKICFIISCAGKFRLAHGQHLFYY